MLFLFLFLLFYFTFASIINHLSFVNPFFPSFHCILFIHTYIHSLTHIHTYIHTYIHYNRIKWFHNETNPDYHFDMFFQDDGSRALFYAPYAANSKFSSNLFMISLLFSVCFFYWVIIHF